MSLTRPENPMPEDIAARLDAAGLAAAYAARPPYQRNDYLGWIARAKRPETRAKRIEETARLAQNNIRANQWKKG